MISLNRMNGILRADKLIISAGTKGGELLLPSFLYIQLINSLNLSTFQRQQYPLRRKRYSEQPRSRSIEDCIAHSSPYCNDGRFTSALRGLVLPVEDDTFDLRNP